MRHDVSRRKFVASSGALAVGVLSGASSDGALQQAGGAKPGNQLTAGMIDFHVHTAPDTAERTISGRLRSWVRSSSTRTSACSSVLIRRPSVSGPGGVRRSNRS
jgi:hypothetical protein